jgi:hypothetical protein
MTADQSAGRPLRCKQVTQRKIRMDLRKTHSTPVAMLKWRQLSVAQCSSGAGTGLLLGLAGKFWG